MLITTGTGFSEIGKITPEKLKEIREIQGLRGPTLDKVGWKYDYFGIFWLDIWNWGGEYCVYSGDTYAQVNEEEAAELLGTPGKKLGKPLNYRMPYGLMLVFGLISLKFIPRIVASRRAKASAGAQQWSPPASGYTPPPFPARTPQASTPPPMPPPMPPDQQ